MAEDRFNFQWSSEEGFSLPDPEELLAEERAEDVRVASVTARSEPPFEGRLTQRDLLEFDNLNAIRDYMVRRRGVQYNDMEPEKVVDDFVENMRYFNTNMVSTAGEVRFVSQASDEDKEAARRAYELYDNLGNVFVNDGFFGAVEGIGDYIGAAVTDPSNYIGLLTGGVAKAGAAGMTTAGRALVRQAMAEAGERAVASGATRQAAEAASQRAALATAERLAHRNITGEAADRIVRRVAQRDADSLLLGVRRTAEREVMKPLEQRAGRFALYGTTALDGTFAAINEHQIQNAMLTVGAQEEYSRTQTLLSSVLGLVGGGAQLLGRQATGASGLGDTATRIEQARMRGQSEFDIRFALDAEEIEEVSSMVMDAVSTWEQKYTRGSSMFDPNVTPADLLHDIMLGADGKGGLAKLFNSKGLKLSRNTTVSDVMTNLAAQLPQSKLKEINDVLQKRIGVTLGETTEMGQTLGDLLAKDIRQAAQTLNVLSQVRRTIDTGLVHGTNLIDGINKQAAVKEAIAAEKSRMDTMDGLTYAQSVWRRLLVSSPNTSMVNLAGWTQFNIGQTTADLFNSAGLGIAGVAMMPVNRAKGQELLRMGRVYRSIQAQKMRNFMDPYTTHDAYMDFLNDNKDVSKALFESYAGGVERASVKFNIDPDTPWFKRTEVFTEAMNNLTGVRIQDSFTKSQMFMTELDKNLRLVKNQSLMDVMEKGTIEAIDDEVLSLTMDTTLKSVFSKNYTTDDQMLRAFAKGVENLSNLPGFGTILPFGRFFNNVIASTYQWGPLGFLTPLKAVMQGKAQTKAGQVGLLEATSRAAVGTTMLKIAYELDQERRDRNLAWNEVETSGGTVIDAKNTYPLSLLLVLGRYTSLALEGQTIPRELKADVGTQLAVGQLARDMQFGNDVNNLLDAIANMDAEDSRATWEGIFKGLGKTAGNLAAGFTRPLDAVNKLVGYMDDSDAARDIRQAESATDTFTQASTRYVDNIFEAMFGRIDAVSGEELRIATRSGNVVDPNPVARVFGISVRPSRTSTEQAYAMADEAEWTATARSNDPEYDRVFATLIQPRLEVATERLTRDRRYIEGNADARRTMLRQTASQVQSEVREYMSRTGTQPQQLLALRRRASMMGNETLRNMALDRMRERLGVNVSIRDMGYRELQYFMDVMDSVEDAYRTR